MNIHHISNQIILIFKRINIEKLFQFLLKLDMLNLKHIKFNIRRINITLLLSTINHFRHINITLSL